MKLGWMWSETSGLNVCWYYLSVIKVELDKMRLEHEPVSVWEIGHGKVSIP